MMLDELRVIEQALRFREGGHVERMHVIPHHGTCSVAEHSWHAAALLMVLHPNPSKRLIKAVLLHDVHERWDGDVPRHATVAHAGLRSAVGDVEYYTRTKLGIIDAMESLNAEEQLWLQAVDSLEFLLWCEDQIVLGNKHVETYKSNIWRWFQDHKLPGPVKTFLKRFHWHRTNDYLQEKD